jgi:phosphate transport system permease protein
VSTIAAPSARIRRRRIVDVVMVSLCFVAVLVAVAPLASVLGYVAIQGASALNWAFFTQVPGPLGEPGGGMANALVGTLILILLGSCIGVPVGILGGLYLSEVSGVGRLGWWLRFTADVLNGVPSIVIGVFVYTLIVVPTRHFSGFAGGVALGLMMIPIVMRTTEEMVKLVPQSVREASLALGIPWWVTTLRVTLPSAMAGVLTGIMLAVARIGGETAPLLFTAFNNQFWSLRLDQPMASLTVQLYNYAIAPYDEWHRQAWAAALVLMTLTLVLNISARFATRRRFSRRR